MKKIFLPLIAVTISAASTSAVVSCVSASYTQGEVGERVLMVTDSGKVTDHSFNQLAYEAVKQYSNRDPDLENNSKKIGGFSFSARGLSAEKNYVEPITADAFSLISAYKIAAVKGVDMLVLPGFQHAATIDQAAELIGSDKTVVFIDAAAGTKPNVIRLRNNSQLAGFAAGYDAAIWATTRDSNGKFLGAINGNDYVSFGTFGGISTKLVVDNYMWGFMLAIRVFNLKIQSDQNQDQNRHIYFANVGKKGEVEDALKISSTDPHYFTGSFELGGATKTGTVQYLEKNQADIIFPIAGPQIGDTLTNSKAYVIGVDTDQAEQYSSYKSRFVTSALRNLDKLIEDALDHSKANRLNWNDDGSLKSTPSVGGEYWEDDGSEKSYGDGVFAPIQPDWSTDVDQSINPTGAKFSKTLFDYSNVNKWEEFINEINDYYLNQAGDDIEDYMGADKITTMAQKIISLDNESHILDFD